MNVSTGNLFRDQTVILTLKPSTSYAVGTPARAIVTLTSDEPITQPVTATTTDPGATDAGLTTGTFSA